VISLWDNGFLVRNTRRGFPAVNSEWRLICAAHNLLKLPQALA
jgi:hypothetical protein